MQNTESAEAKLHTELMKLKMSMTPVDDSPENFIINSSYLFTISQRINELEERCYSCRIRDEEHPKGCSSDNNATRAVNDIYKYQSPLDGSDNRLVSIHQDFLQRLFDTCDELLSHRMEVYPYELPDSL